MFAIVFASLLATAHAAAVGAATTSMAKDYDIKGTGATTLTPLMSNLEFTYRAVEPNAKVSYTGTGSGAGMSSVMNRQVDFGGSNTLFASNSAAAQMTAAGTPSFWAILQSMSAIVIQYNIPGLVFYPDMANRNKNTTYGSNVGNPDPKFYPVLTMQNVVDMYLGNILNWNDPRILASQAVLAPAGYVFPNQTIRIVYRTDSSGSQTNFLTTLVLANQTAMRAAGLFTTASGLPSHSTLINKNTTTNRASSFPFFRTASPNYLNGVPATGNGQASFRVLLTPNSFGPVSYPFLATGSTFFQLINANGDVVLPTPLTIQNALAHGVSAGSLTPSNAPSLAALSSTIVSSTSPLGNLLFTLNAPTPNAWPMAEFNYVMVPDVVNADCFKALEIAMFILWSLQSQAASSASVFLNYVPIVGSMQKTLINVVVGMRCGADSNQLIFDTIFEYEKSIMGAGIAFSVLSILLAVLVILKRDHPAIEDAGFLFLLSVCIGCAINYYTLFLWIGFPTQTICLARPWVTAFSFIGVFGSIAMSLQEKIVSHYHSPMHILLVRLCIGLTIIGLNLIIPIVWFAGGPPDGTTRLCFGPMENTMRQVVIYYNLFVILLVAVIAIYNDKKTSYQSFPVFAFVLLTCLFVPLSYLGSTVTGTWDTMPPRDLLSVILSTSVGIIVVTFVSNVFMLAFPMYMAFTVSKDQAEAEKWVSKKAAEFRHASMSRKASRSSGGTSSGGSGKESSGSNKEAPVTAPKVSTELTQRPPSAQLPNAIDVKPAEPSKTQVAPLKGAPAVLPRSSSKQQVNGSKAPPVLDANMDVPM